MFWRKRVIIGLGTGRCGTVSLAAFLNDQPSSFVVHEGSLGRERYLLPWDGTGDIERWLKHLRRRAGLASVVGDVGFYFLPYSERIIESQKDVRFVVLKRNREDTVRSYLKKTEGRNHWFRHDGSMWSIDAKWDPVYPKYDIADKEQALTKYWDDYYEYVDSLELKYPGMFKTFDVEEINSLEGRNRILDFAGYKHGKRRVDVGHRKNVLVGYGREKKR